jgi:zinc protease
MHSALLALAGALALAAQPDRLPTIPYQSFQLSNGLNVILSVDRAAPIVAVDVHYDVGSKDERPGRTGFAHLFEHLMFEGSAHVPKGEADRLIENAGGSSNGATSEDQTVYWEQVPSNALEQALFIEADRMGWLLPVLDQAKLDNQREVVLNERRQTVEMQPYGGAMIALAENLWDPEFPYHWTPIGSAKDVKAATLEDVRAFFRRFYCPADASLAIVGDFDPARARRLVEKWFGEIPGSPPPARSRPKPEPLEREKRVTLEDDVALPRLYVAWQSPAVFADGDAALDMVGDILADGKSARLVRRLVMDEQVAQSIMAGQMSRRLGSMFLVVATPKPGQSVDRLLSEIDEEIARLAKEPPTPLELERAVNKAESAAIFGLEPVGGFDGRAAALNRYYFETGSPGYFSQDIGRYRALTPEKVREAAARWLRKDARVVLAVLPRSGEKRAEETFPKPPARNRPYPKRSK